MNREGYWKKQIQGWEESNHTQKNGSVTFRVGNSLMPHPLWCVDKEILASG